MNILVSGSLAYDRIMDFPGRFADHILPEKIHILNVCFIVNGMTEKFGGTAGNIAYSLALLGERPTLLASAGKDFGRYRIWLEKHNIDLSGVRAVSDDFTAGAYITTDKADNQITGFNPGAMKYPCGFDLDGLDPRQTLAIVAPGCLEDMAGYSALFKKRAIPYIADPGQSIPALTDDQLKIMIDGAAILISNDYELELIKSRTGWDVAELVRRAGAVITTLGEKGALVRTRDKTRSIAAARVAAVCDPTGAGDAFRAGLIKGLVLGKELMAAAAMGATCAAYAVEHHGTQEHRFDWDQFGQRLLNAFGQAI